MVDGVEPDPTVTDIDTSKKRVDYNVSADSIHQVTIELLNKCPSDTKVVDGVIIEDLLLIVDQIAVDNIDLTNMLSKISVYKGNNNQIYRTHSYITFNGKMTIKIHKNLLYTNWLFSILN
jgi:hypothetical protein